MFQRLSRPTPSTPGELFSGTKEVRALLDRYAHCGAALEGPSWFIRSLPDGDAPRWWQLPALRFLARMMYVRRVRRGIATLKAAIVRRDGVGFDVSSKKPDLELLDAFEQTLPKSPKPAMVVSASVTAVSVAALVFSTLNGNPDRSMLGDLAHAVLTVDRNGLLDAIPHWAKLQQVHWQLAALAAIADLAATAGILMICFVLPAFRIHRRLFARVVEFEDRARTATAARVVTDIDLDLIAAALFIPEVAFSIPQLAWLVWTFAHYHGPGWAPEKKLVIMLGAFTAALTVLSVGAGLELRRQYRSRRHRIQPRETLIRRGGRLIGQTLLLLMCLLSAFSVIGARTPSIYPDPVTLSLATVNSPPPGTSAWGWVDNGAVWFAVTAIQQRVSCPDPHPPATIGEDSQYLQFTVEIWSRADQFVVPAEAQATALNHWSILDARGDTVADDLYLHPGCSRGGDALIKPLIPGQHTVTEAVVTVPASGIHTLQLVVPSHPTTWRWTIPPVSK